MTWQELIKNALIELGVKGLTEALDQADIDFGMERLRLLLDNWAMSGLFGITKQSHTVTVSKSIFTIGTAAENDIQLEPLNRVDNVTYSPSRDQKERPLVHVGEMSTEQASSNVESDPRYYSYKYNFPNAVLHFERALPVNSRFTLIVPTILSSEGINASDMISMPPGYKSALLYNLAISLAPAYGVKNDQLAASTKLMASDSLKSIKIKISRPLTRTGAS